MTRPFSENDVHEYLYEHGLEALIDDSPEIDGNPTAADELTTPNAQDFEEELEFELWRIIKAKALEKLGRLHRTVRYGQFIGSKIQLPTDHTRPMELDLLGQHDDGLFVLELKVDRSAERNAFSELFAYSNYIAGMFALSGPKDIANILVANLDVKITKQAFLYDLLITNRNIIVYNPVFSNEIVESLRLQLYIPSDDDFRHFANQLLSHNAISCVVASFHDMEGWFDSEEIDGEPNSHTQCHLSDLSSYAAQLMESENFHGFCFIRKRWNEIKLHYPNSLIICAINPFLAPDPERSNALMDQVDGQYHASMFELPQYGFIGRLISIAQRAIKDCLTHDYHCECETPLWSVMVRSPIEVVYTHNFSFHPTGIMREAYVNYLNNIYAAESSGSHVEDVSCLKINEITSWFRAWQFMEMFSDDEN